MDVSEERAAQSSIENVSVPKIEAARFIETLVNFYKSPRIYISEDSNLHKHRCQNLISALLKIYSVTSSSEHIQ
jgi:hypothetical protein